MGLQCVVNFGSRLCMEILEKWVLSGCYCGVEEEGDDAAVGLPCYAGWIQMRRDLLLLGCKPQKIRVQGDALQRVRQRDWGCVIGCELSWESGK